MSITAIRGVIWDLDGVILDSAEQHWRAWHALAGETRAHFSQTDFRATFGQRNADIIPRFWRTGDPAEIARLAERKETIYRDLLKRDATALPGAIDLLRDLRDAGWRQALGSSAPLENIDLILDLLGLRDVLNAIVSGEQAQRGKPAPDIFLAASRALGLAPVKCCVIEDAVAGVQAAQAAGMRCVAVTNGRPNRELAIADVVVSSLVELDVARLTSLVG